MDLDTILLKIDIHVRYTVLPVCNNRLFIYIQLVVANFCNLCKSLKHKISALHV